MHTYQYRVCVCVCVLLWGDVGGLVAPAAAECRGGDDDDTRVKHFFTQSISIHIIYLYYYMARDTKKRVSCSFITFTHFRCTRIIDNQNRYRYNICDGSNRYTGNIDFL